MTRRSAVLCIAASSAASLLAACSLLVPHWTYRYRLTIEVERDGKIFSGSSVIEVRREKGINGVGAKTRGEAVAVDWAEATLCSP